MRHWLIPNASFEFCPSYCRIIDILTLVTVFGLGDLLVRAVSLGVAKLIMASSRAPALVVEALRLLLDVDSSIEMVQPLFIPTTFVWLLAIGSVAALKRMR